MDGPSRLFGNGLKYFCDLLAIELRNMEAIGLAQQKMLEGMGVLAQHQAQMAEGTLRRSFGAQPSVPTSASGLHAAVIGQITSLKTTMQESQANSNVLSELAARSSGDVANENEQVVVKAQRLIVEQWRSDTHRRAEAQSRGASAVRTTAA